MNDKQKFIKLIESYLGKIITANAFSDNYEMLYWRDLDEDGSISAEEEE
ncbi:MAG TPA: hypothetical protein VK135_08015 [Candidatus Dormibacteraeota bacterium]|nr:hypothetical protein [Candidatus Dormibacteraeota bacterium]